MVSINVQRGRDHGLSGYNSYRKLFGLSPILTLEQKPDEIEEDAWEAIKMVYREPDDIDLFLGGLAEKPLDGKLFKFSV